MSNHADNLRQANLSTFKQTGHHLQMHDYRVIHLEHRRFLSALAPGVLLPFLDSSLGGLVVGSTSFDGFALSPGLATAKWTIDIVSLGITRMGQKQNAAVPASLQARAQVG
jgi:hypothetical protein